MGIPLNDNWSELSFVRFILTERTMKRITLIFVSCFLFCLNLSAQDVEGVAIDSSMTKVQVVEKFGEPEEYTLKLER